MTEVATPVATQAVAAPKVMPGLPIKPTSEEVSKRQTFIGMCVDRGINFPSNNKFGVMGAMNLQDICNSSVQTIADIALKVKKEEAMHDPEFSRSAVLKINGILATDWLEFFRLTIKKKSWDIYASEQRARSKELKKVIEQALTPEEKRKKAEEEYDTLKEFEVED